MIHESEPWKRLLLEEAARLEHSAKTPFSEARSIDFERALFFSAYIIRKLAEAKKLSSDYDLRNIPVELMPAVKHGMDWTNSYKWDQFYDIGQAKKQTLSIRRIADILIHSLIMVELMDEIDHVIGFYVTSDRNSSRAIYAVDLADWLAVMRWVGTDSVIAVNRSRKEPGGPWIETRIRGVPSN